MGEVRRDIGRSAGRGSGRIWRWGSVLRPGMKLWLILKFE
jgi:hypothetical protein